MGSFKEKISYIALIIVIITLFPNTQTYGQCPVENIFDNGVSGTCASKTYSFYCGQADEFKLYKKSGEFWTLVETQKFNIDYFNYVAEFTIDNIQSTTVYGVTYVNYQNNCESDKKEFRCIISMIN
jgi:hypothetical protein